MTLDEIESVCLALPGASLSIKWGDHRVYVVAEKMFAMLSGPGGPQHLSFKVSDIAFDLLTQRDGVIPAPYLQRAKWVRLETLDALDAEELTARLAEAHRLIVAKLPKRLRPALA